MFADDPLNGIGAPPTPLGSTVSPIGGLFKDIGVDAAATEKASVYLSPLARALNVLFALIIGLATLGMLFTTALDMIFIALPSVRKSLSQSSVNVNMVQPGVPQQQMPQTQSIASHFQQWISDEALAVVAVRSGRDFTGMSPQQQSAPTRSLLAEYMKRRIFFMLLFGVCTVLFSVTVLTDFGITIGTWLLNGLLNLTA